MSKLNERQTLLLTILAPALVVAAVSWLAWRDYQKIHAWEIGPDGVAPEEALVADSEGGEEGEGGGGPAVDPEEFGEIRRMQEIQKEMDRLQGEADLINKREQDVIVYREIVHRDSQILPDQSLVNDLTKTINEFERQSGVVVTSVGDLNVVGSGAIGRLPIRLALQGSFDQFLKFLNLFETQDRIVNTKGLSISAGTRLTDNPDEPAVHTIALELETFVYNPGAGLAKPVEIANYERRKDDPVIQKLVRQQKAARVEKYALKPRISRRDPLVDPRRRQAGPEEGAVSQERYEEQRVLVERLRHEIETLKEDVRLEQQYLQEKKYLQYVQLKSLNDERITALEAELRDAEPKVTVPELKEQFSDEVAGQFNRVAGDRAKRADADVSLVTRQHVSEFLERQRAAFEAAEYDKVVAIHKQLEELLGAKNRKVADEAQALVADMRERSRQAAVMLEFLAIDLKVSGVIRRERGSVVILCGRARKEGDVIDEKGRCRLVAIRDDALVFDFDGYEILHPLRAR